MLTGCFVLEKEMPIYTTVISKSVPGKIFLLYLIYFHANTVA